MIFVRALGVLSPASGEKIAGVLGAVWFALDKKHRRITLENIAQAYGSELNREQRRKFALTVFKNAANMLFEHARFDRTKPRDYSKILSVRGFFNLKAAQARGKGVLCFSAHLGNWEVTSALGSMVDVPFSVVYRRLESQPLDRYINEKRSATGSKMLTMHKALDGVLATLDRGELVGLLIDQNVRKRTRGVFVDFFGRKACANSGLARLALSTGAPVIPIFIFKAGGKFVIEILPEIPLVRTGDEARDILENTRIYNALIEKYVRKYPEQWFWIHNRWRTRPLDEKRKG
ncbi:MAG: lysophospholipid acyltransferase family protein [Desulfobacteraceae bacterium]|nr:lysophospholipid acyltransferase family protein [Desulfobacteraceae bacterium]